MRRVLVPAELRYMEMEPGPGWIRYAEVALTAGVIAGGGALASGIAALLALVPVVAAASAYVAIRLADERDRPGRLVTAPLAVVPWGIVVHPSRPGQPLRWTSIQAIRHRVVKRSRWGRTGEDEMPRSVVEIDTEEQRFQGMRRELSEWLASLPDLFRGWSAEQARPVALDLDATPSLAVERPMFEVLAERARHLLESRDGAVALALPAAGYRGTHERVAGPETVAILRRLLDAGGSAPDTGPLAAILAAELGARELLPQVLALVMSPIPLLAAICKGAALRLGAAPFQPGTIGEVHPFLGEAQILAIEQWAKMATN